MLTGQMSKTTENLERKPTKTDLSDIRNILKTWIGHDGMEIFNDESMPWFIYENKLVLNRLVLKNSDLRPSGCLENSNPLDALKTQTPEIFGSEFLQHPEGLSFWIWGLVFKTPLNRPQSFKGSKMLSLDQFLSSGLTNTYLLDSNLSGSKNNNNHVEEHTWSLPPFYHDLASASPQSVYWCFTNNKMCLQFDTSQRY